MKKNMFFKEYVLPKRISKWLKITKLLTFFMILGTFQLSAVNSYSQIQKINLKLKNSNLREAFKAIEEQSEYTIFFKSDDVTFGKSVDLDIEGKDISEALNKILAGTGLTYTIRDKVIVILSEERLQEQQQASTITGTVRDISGESIPGVTVQVKGTQTGTITDMDGHFSLTVPAGAETLVFSFVGMETQEVPIGDSSFFNVEMQESVLGLDEVVVVGYGTQIKRDVTGSVQSINADEWADMPVPQLAQKIQGKTSGVEVLQTTGIPGQGMTIRIRGAASINASNEPLYVVDGFPIVGDISSINPDEIESISILKDASATSLYGSRAANGVVLIQTKQARPGKTNISVNAYRGIQTVPQKGRPDMMNAAEFAQFEKEIREEYADYTGTTASIPEEYQHPEEYGKGTDWYDILLRNAIIENYSLSVTSGKDKFSTAVVGAYMNQEGVLRNSDFQRYSLRVNAKYKLTDQVEMGVNVAPSYSLNATPNSDGSTWSGGVLESALLTSPLAVARNEDGTLPLTAESPGMFPNPNWYRVVKEVKNDTRTSHILANAYLNFEIVKDLNFKTSINADLQSKEKQYFRPSTSGSLYAAPPQKTEGSITNTSYYTWLNENTLTYTKTIDDNHHFNALLGYTVQRYRYDYNYLYGTDYPDDEVPSLNAAATTNGESDIEEWSLLSWVGRLNYNFKDKYLISMAMRRDGSSRFGKNNKWGNFPSVSVGWIASDEKFLSLVSPLSYLKFRASYGLTGNNDIGNYTYYAGVETANYVFNGTLSNGKATTSLSNSELGWEKTKQLDVGVDLGLFKDRIFFQYDYFRKKTDDMLYSMSVPQESGYDEIMTNLGVFKFWGHEVALTTKNMVNNFKWNTDFNISFVRNKVVDLGPGIDYIGGSTSDTHITKVGGPISQFYGYVWEGVYMDEEDYENSPRHATSEVGTVKMKDVDGDKDIDADDRTEIGNPDPKFTFGLTNSFSYKNFDLNIVISGAYGNKIMNRTLESTENLDGVFNVTRECGRRWRSPEDPGDGILPRAMVGTALSRQKNSRWVSDGSYATIKNITLGYTLPWKEKYFRSIRVYGSIQQALVITKYKGSNPEVDDNGNDSLSRGVDWSNYPVPRTVTIGVNVNL